MPKTSAAAASGSRRACSLPGPRTNPWFQECSARVIEAGDIVAFDTDLIGPYGYCCDISRTWLAGDGRPTNEQRALYAQAEEQIAANMEMLRPGRSFRELSHAATSVPADYLAEPLLRALPRRRALRRIPCRSLPGGLGALRL